MARINIGGGRWFDPATSKNWEEDTNWNGNNHISVATGTQYDHEKLYKTKSGTWILHWWSQWQGSRERYTVIPEADAYTWLLDNGHEVPSEALKAAEL